MATDTKQETPQVGDCLYEFNENHRVYARDASGSNRVVFRKHFIPHASRHGGGPLFSCGARRPAPRDHRDPCGRAMKRSEIPRDSGAVVGCYSVHLYCTHPNHATYDARWYDHYGSEYTGETEAECLSIAHDNGWWISRYDADFSRAVLCPYHAKEVPR